MAPKPFTKKRLGKEIGKIGRNIKQRLLCAVFDKETEHDQVTDEQEETMDTDMHQGHREAGLQQFPATLRILSWNCRGLGSPSTVLQWEKKRPRSTSQRSYF